MKPVQVQGVLNMLRGAVWLVGGTTELAFRPFVVAFLAVHLSGFVFWWAAVVAGAGAVLLLLGLGQWWAGRPLRVGNGSPSR